MKRRRLLISTAGFIIAAAIISYLSDLNHILAQHSISTRSGLISRVQGEVLIGRAGGDGREKAAAEMQMQDGDRLDTGMQSRAEILLNPATYLRLDEQSGVRAVSTALTEARFELLDGIFLVQAGNSELNTSYLFSGRGGPLRNPMPDPVPILNKLAFEIETPHVRAAIAGNGVYLFTVNASTTMIEVYEGELMLSGRVDPLLKKANRIKAGKRAIWVANDPASPSVADRKLKSFEGFDRWGFPIVKHGVVRRVEGEALANLDSNQDQLFRVTPEFQLREGQFLETGKQSYLQLAMGRGGSVTLNQRTRIMAVKTETDEAVYELIRGSVIVESSDIYPARTVGILTSQGSFSVMEEGSSARFEVNPQEISVRVRKGNVRRGKMEIGSGKGWLLAGESPFQEKRFEFEKNEVDAFDRWSSGTLSAGTIVHSEGRVVLQREGGGKLDLEKNSPKLRVQLLEGGRLSTGHGGRAALGIGTVLVHVDEKSEIVAVSAEEKTREFELLNGDAIVYMGSFFTGALTRGGPPALFYSKTSLRISTPHLVAVCSNSGDFRFDADSSGTRIDVRSGSLQIASTEDPLAKTFHKVKSKQTAFWAAGESIPKITASHASSLDDFDKWSVGVRDIPAQKRY